MERSWVETMQLLGLDVVALVTAALAVAEWTLRRARAQRHRRRSDRRTLGAGRPKAVGSPVTAPGAP